jgi:hypothetical protein
METLEMNKVKGIIIIIGIAIATLLLYIWFFARSSLTSFFRYVSGKAGYTVYGTEAKEIGAPIKFSTYEELTVNDGLNVGETAGIRMYQKVGIGAIESLMKTAKAGDISQVPIVMTPVGADALWVRMSWNYASDNMIRDFVINITYKALQSGVSAQDVIDSLQSVPWLAPILQVMDFDVQTYQIA